MYRYRYTHDVPVAFTGLRWVPNNGDEIDSDVPLNHAYLELVVPTKEEVAPKPARVEAVQEVPADAGSANKESPVTTADISTKE